MFYSVFEDPTREARMDKRRMGLVLLVAAVLLVYWIYKDTRRGSAPVVIPRIETTTDQGEVDGALAEQGGLQEGPFLYAKVSRSQASLPRRYQAKLPATLEELRGDWSGFPPRAYVEDLLCQGDPAMLQRLLEALHRAAASTQDPGALADFGTLFGYCSSPELCSFARGLVEGGEMPPVKRVFWAALVRCGGSEFDALFERPEAPALVAAERTRERSLATSEPPPRAKGVDELVREYPWRDVRSYLKEKPKDRPKILAALERCLAGEPLANSRVVRYQQPGCLEHLAVLDRPRAVEQARNLLNQEDIPERLLELAETLDRYPEAGALQARLAELGLLKKKGVEGDRLAAEEDPGLAARDILAACGRTHWFDVETGQFPNEHDHLLRELAKLVKPDLDGAVFEEIPPRETEDGREIGPYRLSAYLDGQKVSVAAENLGDWYDVGAVLGLLNTLLRERQSELRFVTLPTGDQTAIVLAGPAKGILRAVDEGLLQIEGAEAGMEAGKAFEERVLKKLEEEGEIILKGPEH
jgi:hypothetical protein